MLKLLKYLKEYKKQAIVGPIFKLIEAVLELCIPILMAYLIDNGIKQSDLNLILSLGGIMMAVTLIGSVCSFICQYSGAVAGQGFGTNLRNAMLKKISSLSHSQLDALPPSAIMTRMTSDINQLQLGVSMFIRLVTRVPFLLIFGIVITMTININLSLILVASIPIFGLVVFLITRKTVPQYKKVQARLDDIGKTVKENLAGQRVIRAFNKEEEELNNSLNINKAYAKEALKSGRLSSLFSPITLLIINFCIVLILWLGGIQVNTGIMSAGEVIAFINYVVIILSALIVMSNIIIIFAKALASATRVLDILEIPVKKENSKLKLKLAPKRYNGFLRRSPNACSDGRQATWRQTDCMTNTHRCSNISRLCRFDKTKPLIEFKNVTFNYQNLGENEINNISFKIFDKQNIGIIGPTGSGKTTLINLLQGFYAVTSGEILIYGINVNLINKTVLRRLFGPVPQKSVLFSGTIKENIQIGKSSATDEEIIKACEIAQADKFIDSKENSYEGVVNTGGSNFSGGQRQRLTIARALVKNPHILILDDAGSALDYATELRLRKALKKNLPDCTVINISQRIFSVKTSDLILVLKNGNLEGAGTHEELIQSCKTYKEFNASQEIA